jgi:uncharacterized delta-60 repeat protein
MRRSLLTLALALALLGTAVAVALATPGDLDTGFGDNGRRVLDYGGEDSATDVAVQPDGKIVVVGIGGDPSKFKVTRLDADGKPDSGFGSGGTVTLDFAAGGAEQAYSVALVPGGRIVVAGWVDTGIDTDVAVARLLSNGDPDPSFDEDGKREINVGDSARAYTVAIDKQGEIVVGGDGTGGLLVMSLDPNGAFDAGFNNGAPLQFQPAGTFNPSFSGLALTDRGSIVVAGTDRTGDDTADVFISSVASAGNVDDGFGQGGTVIRDLGGNDAAGGIAVQPDGKIVMASRAGAAEQFSIARFNADGDLDDSFGTGGHVGIDSGGYGAADVMVQRSGKLLATGFNDALRAIVMRVQPGGTLDTTFGGGSGVTSNVFGGVEDNGRAGALQADGKIVIAGQTNQNAVVARLQGDGQAGGGGPAPTPGSGSPSPGGGGGGGGGAGSKSRVPRCGGKRATIVGTARKDRLKGTRRADVIVALGGADRVSGGGGNDLICAGSGDDRIDGGAGNDRVYGQDGKDNLTGAAGNDLLDGGAGNDHLTGSSGNDSLAGGPGKDGIAGDSGKDKLSGGSGRDSCNGGGAKDRAATCERRSSV